MQNQAKTKNLFLRDSKGQRHFLVVVRGEKRVESLRIVDVFRAGVVDSTSRSFVFEITGAPEKIDAFADLMRPLGLEEVASLPMVPAGRALPSPNAAQRPNGETGVIRH